jgi:saccharopine dehydrogenase (NAD+, L-lysine-forming)
MANILIIGAGGAGSVLTQKCAMNPEVFSKIHLASRTLSKCEAIQKRCKNPITISQLDADNTQDVITCIKHHSPDLVINMALPYQDLSIMDACLETETHYLDTANYEPKDDPKFCYKWQWDYHEKFKNKGIMALLGSGFDPGVTNVFCAYAQQSLFDEVHEVDIIDCNDGNHGHPFATNFNPEINIREITQKGKYWKNGEWIETDPLSINKSIEFPEVGPRDAYLMYHEELESLAKNLPYIKQLRFWMTFSKEYLTHLRVLEGIGMTSITPINYNGHEIVPLQFLKAVLPEPSSLAENYTGKTSIGCIINGIKDGTKKQILIYNVCEHQQCYDEVGAQAVSYTTGLPAMVGAMMILTKKWFKPGVFNMEEFPASDFLAPLAEHGLPWHIKEL